MTKLLFKNAPFWDIIPYVLRNVPGQLDGEVDILVRINGVFKRFFAWLVRPVINMLYPHRARFVVRHLANTISVLRMLLSLVVNYEIATASAYQMRLGYIVIIVVLMLTDGIDGALARGLKTESFFGKIVDPLADKVLFGGMLWGLCMYFGSTGYIVLAAVLAVIELMNVYYGVTLMRLCINLETVGAAGASGWGKLKFGMQCVLGLLGWVIPDKLLAFSVTLPLLIIVVPLALMSLKGYYLRIKMCNESAKLKNAGY